MAVVVATHSGPFHADDVLAWALLRTFLDPEATVVRTRDADRIDLADIAIDVGRVYEPSKLRFDHHQVEYTGPLSSAGMVLGWLEAEDHLTPQLAHVLRHQLVEYVDAVDNGRQAPSETVPCFPRIVEAMSQGHPDNESFDRAFRAAGDLAALYVEGVVRGFEAAQAAEAIVVAEMERAAAEGHNVLVFEQYVTWKGAYFARGGAAHPTEYVMFPSMDATWKIVAIPPREGAFAQKRPLPESWAGLSDAELEAASGVSGAIFCHKNRFIAGFQTRESAERALRSHDLWLHRSGGVEPTSP